jgi:hypothetical protein
MKLQMKDLDMNDALTDMTFACLANVQSGWEVDAQRDNRLLPVQVFGKRSNVKLSTETPCRIPWRNGKRAAQKEVSKVKELQSSGLTGPRRNQTSRDRHSYQNTGTNMLTQTRQIVSTSQWTLSTSQYNYPI